MPDDVSGGPDTPEDRRVRRSILSAVFGNFMEYIDFGSYGFVAAILGAQFFPKSAPGVQLLSSLAVFGVSFLFRPLGGAIFGYIGDRFGRRVALTWSVIVMGLATTAIGLIPGYATIGALGPALLVLMRALQGISVGGEYSGAAAFVVECAPRDRRGLWASSLSVTAALGTVVGTAIVLALTAALPAAAMSSWGWRVPFLIALPLTGVGLYMRLRLGDTPVFRALTEQEPEHGNPYRRLGRSGLKNILLSGAIASATGLGYYYFATYFNTYLSATVGVSRSEALLLSLISLLVYAACCPLAGIVSDRWGRKRLMLAGFAGMIVFGVPVFLLLGANFSGALVGMLLFGALESILNVLTVVVLPELFSAVTRVTGGAIGYNLGIGLISGTGPFVAAALVAGTGNAVSPGYYLGGIMLAVALIVVFALPETGKRSLYAGPAPEGVGTPETSRLS